jgi:5'-nucleotidase
LTINIRNSLLPTILVTNDDGVQSPGLLALTQALREIADVVVLAPDSNWSASSHAKTMDKPLRLRTVTLADGSQAFAGSGSPTDCVAMAAGGVLGIMPDLVVAGINAGHNMGIDISYSGTVACAKEATIKKIPGVAVSTVFPGQTDVDLDIVRGLAAEIARDVAQQVLDRGLPPETLLNVNVPGVAPSELQGIHVTRVGHRRYDNDELIERHDPYGQPYYWIGGAGPNDKLDDGTDVGAVARGFVSITPITLEMTDHKFLNELDTWGFTA